MHALPLTAEVDTTIEELTHVLTDKELVEFRCVRCGYGIALTGQLPPCPMCRTRLWELIEQRA